MKMKKLLIYIKRLLLNVHIIPILMLNILRYRLSIVYILIGLWLSFNYISYSQIYPANPSNWLFLEGNVSATKQNPYPSQPQSFDSLVIKWSTPLISGEVQPLIGNIINNPKLNSNFLYSPNEMAAVMGNRIVLINGTGKLAKIYEFPEFVRGVKSLNLLLDTLSTDIRGSNAPVLLFTESMETSYDSIAHSYIFGYDTKRDTILISRRLAIDMRAYKPNIYASIKPFAGKLFGNEVQIYATVNTHTPELISQNPPFTPFLRGLVKFNLSSLSSSFPLPDVGDDLDYRITLGPEVNKYQPSIANFDNTIQLVLPSYPSIADSVNINNPVTLATRSNRPYLMGFDISDNTIKESIFPRDFRNIADGKRALVRPYFVDLEDEQTGENTFLLVTEEYSGLEGSDGVSKLHLFTKEGDPITFPSDPVFPPIIGGKNHYWSIAVGNVDGPSWNSWGQFYPNNRGKELVVTQSSKEFAYPTNKLMILRYKSNGDYEKPSPPNTFLNQFDTICTQRINGWVACVNDFDGHPDGKEEIFLVDGGTLKILRLRYYNSEEFRLGRPFDTVFTHTFVNQTIFSVAVADLEGDSKNDIIVTTNDSTYVLGTVIPNSFSLIAPKIQQSPPEMYCYGDTLRLKWTNFTLTEQSIQIRFQETQDTIPIGEPVVIDNNVSNNSDTIIYNLAVNEQLIGKEGFFILSGNKNPNTNNDTTAIISFEMPRLNLDEFSKVSYRILDEIIISGFTKCVDSISIEFALNDTLWQNFGGAKIPSSDTFNLKAIIPCLDIFNCKKYDSTSTLLARVLIHKYFYTDTSQTYSLNIKPALLPVTLLPCPTNCPTRRFTWDTLMLKSMGIDTLHFYFSASIGDSLGLIGTVGVDSLGFEWNLPYNLPEKVLIRVCGGNGCFRYDTILTDPSPKYINTVSPNPFRPNYGQLEIVYAIPQDDFVTIRIIDQANRIVRVLIDNQQRQGNIIYCDKWDGYNSKNEPIANGMYYIWFELSNGTKEIYPVFIRK